MTTKYSPTPTPWKEHNYQWASPGKQYLTAEYVEAMSDKYRRERQEARSGAEGTGVVPVPSAPQEGRTCAICGTVFQPRDKRQQYCGERCRNKSKARIERTRVCEECGRTYRTTNGRSVVCGPGCQVIRKARQNEESRKRRRAA